MTRAPIVHGIDLDLQTRCAHWHSPLDIVAIKTACCQTYYACKDCHAALADHPLMPWPRAAWVAPAVLCGACGCELSVDAYLACAAVCPSCGSAFNPRCANHHHFYFAV